ncbi:heme/copper-type cytochrome/quinol oxidase subunit 2 [Paenibacillus polymyxa]
MKWLDKTKYVLSTLAMAILLPMSSASAGANQGALPSKLSGAQQIIDDINKAMYWVIWSAGPIFFFIALYKHMASNDPSEKKTQRKWMKVIVGSVIGGQLAVWFLHDYLTSKFGG